MDIDSLTHDQLGHFIEGVCCYAPEGDLSLEASQKLALGLIEYHELNDEDILAGIAYYERGEGLKPNLEYDWDRREDYFANIGH